MENKMKVDIVKSTLRGLSLIVFIVLMSGCGATGIVNLQSGNILAEQEWLTESDHFTVPFEWHDGHPIINLNVNGQQNLRFALDSGAATTVLFETPNTQGIYLDIEMQFDMQGKKVNVVNNTTIMVGDIQISDMTIIHVPLDQSPLFGSADEAYFDGAIGYDLLNRFQVKVNYADASVTFYKDASIDLANDDWLRLPISLIGRVPQISAILYNTNDKQSAYKFTIDTGAPDYLYINSSLAKDLMFPIQYFQSKMKNFEGEYTFKTSRIDVFKIGDAVFENIATHDLPNFKDQNSIGLIGSGLLKNFDVIFDYENEYIALKKNHIFATSTFIDRSGLQLEPHKQGAIVKYVANETHASKLEILPGDVVTTIGNQKVNEANFDQLRALLSSDKKEIELCWLSAKKELCDALLLQDRI